MTQNKTVRPTKKQRELLTYIKQFINDNGYSPSYREIMNGLAYTSVATVSVHVNNLIKRGHLRKRDHSARTLEVVEPGETVTTTADQFQAAIDALFESDMTPDRIVELETVVTACGILKLSDAADLLTRLDKIRANT